MMGLLVVVFFVVYLAISVLIVVCSVRYVRRRFGHGWVGGVLAGFFMFGLVFWDAIPTWYTHYHLCASEAGLIVHQTPEEWAKENPERYRKARESSKRVVENSSYDGLDAMQIRTEYSSGLILEGYSSRRRNYAFNTGVVRERVFDKVTGKVLFEVVDFHGGAGVKSLSVGASNLSDYKFWTVTGFCRRAYPGISDKFKYRGRDFFDFLKAMEGWDAR